MNPKIIHIDPAVLEQIESLHGAELRFQAYQAASNDLTNEYHKLRHEFVANPCQATQSAFEIHCASAPARAGLLNDIRLGVFEPGKIYKQALTELLAEPLRREVSRLQDELAASIDEDEAQAAIYDSGEFESGKTKALTEFVEIATEVWKLVKSSAATASVITKLGYPVGDILARSSASIAAHRSNAELVARMNGTLGLPKAPDARLGLRRKLGMEHSEEAVTASAKPRKKLEVEMLAH
jgi:hypothetical protein